MKGYTIELFMEDLLTMGGPEKEFSFRGRTYFMQVQRYEKDRSLKEFEIFECFGDQNYLFRCQGKTFLECTQQFEVAPIFDGMTIYEAESEIEVLSA